MLERTPKSLNRDDAALEQDSFASQLISLRQIARFVRQYRRIIAISILAPISLALFYLMFAQPIYTARAQLLLDPQTPQPLQEPAGNGNSTFDSPQVESQIVVLRSEKIALTVANTLDLLKDPEFQGDSSTPPDEAAAYERTRGVVADFMGSLDVRRVGASYAIEIAFSSRDPEKAAKIANTVAEAFVQDQLAARAQAVRAGSEWLEGRIDLLRKQMNTSALKVQEFKVKRDYRILGRGGPDAEPKPVAPAPATAPPVAAVPGAPQLPSAAESLTLEELESTAQTYRRIYESYLQAYTESVQRQSFPVSNARVITLATRPLSKSHPKSFLILALAGLIGTLTGFGIALVRHNFSNGDGQDA